MALTQHFSIQQAAPRGGPVLRSADVDPDFFLFPAGCTVDPDHIPSILEPCCLTVGSAPTHDETDDSLGCPYNDEFAPAANQSFVACAIARGAASVSCAAAPTANLGSVRAAMPNGSPSRPQSLLIPLLLVSAALVTLLV